MFVVSGEEYETWKDVAETVLILGSDLMTMGVAEIGWTAAAVYQVSVRKAKPPTFVVTFVYGPDGHVLSRLDAAGEEGMCGQ